jgi:hypothetical protein
MEKLLGTTPKTLHKHKKFRVQLDVNDELACWAIICRHPYKDRLLEGVRAMVHEYWVENSHVSLNVRDVVQQ